MPELSGSVLVMQKILLDCVKLNFALGRFGPRTHDIQVTAKIDYVRNYTNAIAQKDYTKAVDHIKMEQLAVAGKDMQTRYNESIYWDIIKKGAELIDPNLLPTPKGPLNCTRAEKEATKKFMQEVGCATSSNNQSRYIRLWKALSDMRKAGVTNILLYRTQEFDDFCARWPSGEESALVQKVLSWEKIYGPQIEQLQYRVAKASYGDVSGRSWLKEPCVAERLDIPDPETSWNSAQNLWFSDLEEIDFKSNAGSLESSSDILGGLFGIQAASEENKDKSIFVNFLPGDERLYVIPIISIRKDDLLGIFAGHIRYSESFEATHGIRGPRQNLWLDYSRVTGVLNLMRVLPPGGNANVRLVWELYELEGESQLEWRVSVRATRDIKPFEEIVRLAHEEAQYHMHQDAACARRGFLK
jgi:hypothetical protein